MTTDVNDLVEAGAAEGADPRKVFVIYGRNRSARVEVFAFLRSIGLDPIEWEHALQMTGQATPYVGEVLTAAFTAAQAIVVLQTPDDIVYLDGDFCDPNDPDDPEGQPQGQPRPNVFFEAGMAMGVSEKRTVIVEFGKVKKFTDIGGRHVVRLDNSIERRNALAQRLRTAGCLVNLDAVDWHTAGDLTPPAGPGGGRPLGKRIPRTASPRTPHLDGRYIDRGGNKIGIIEIVNHGPGDALNLSVVGVPDDLLNVLRDNGNLPFPKLPEHKSVAILDFIGNRGMGQRRASLTFTVSGETSEGDPFEQEIFVSLGAV